MNKKKQKNMKWSSLFTQEKNTKTTTDYYYEMWTKGECLWTIHLSTSRSPILSIGRLNIIVSSYIFVLICAFSLGMRLYQFFPDRVHILAFSCRWWVPIWVVNNTITVENVLFCHSLYSDCTSAAADIGMSIFQSIHQRAPLVMTRLAEYHKSE